jgi:hypothetical protein
MLGAFSIDELAKGFGLLSIAAFLAIFFFRGLNRGRPPDVAVPAAALPAAAPTPSGRPPDVAAPAAAPAAAPTPSFTQLATAWFKTRLPWSYAFVDAALAAIGIVGLVLTILNWTSLWRVLWIPHAGALDLNRLVFPDLNGKWTGRILSNGRQHGYEDVSSPLSHADCVKWFGDYDEKNFVCLHINYDISMSLFSIDLQLDTGTLKSVSRSVSLKRRDEQNPAQFTYLFDVKTSEPQREDVKFTGAASINVVESGKDLTLEGIYWTERNWQTGKQTGGRIKLIRASVQDHAG